MTVGSSTIRAPTRRCSSWFCSGIVAKDAAVVDVDDDVVVVESMVVGMFLIISEDRAPRAAEIFCTGVRKKTERRTERKSTSSTNRPETCRCTFLHIICMIRHAFIHNKHTDIHIYIHTYIHTYRQTHIYTHPRGRDRRAAHALHIVWLKSWRNGRLFHNTALQEDDHLEL
jgi:hypothetical protein